jgi:iron complex outermembrane recepter protein
MRVSSIRGARRKLFGPQASLIALLALGATPALAQDAPQTGQASAQTETIQVTGTRIRNTDAQAANPITVVSSEDIAQEKSTNVEDILRKLPSIDFSGGINAGSNNGGDGASEIGLRNLGPTRTLVLVNGYRFPNTDTEGSSTAVDLNSIPVNMIDHIEVLRDGAASIYGADAIAGVVNIITKQHYNGVEVHGAVGETSYGDGLNYSAGSMMGADFDRGNILIDVETSHTDPVSQGARSWSTNNFLGDNTASSNFAACANCSSKLPFLTGNIGNSSTTMAFLGPNNVVPINDPSLYKIPGILHYNVPAFGIDEGLFDLTQQPDLTVGQETKQFNFTGHYDILPNVTAVLEGFYTDRTSTEVLNPEPLSSTISTLVYPGLVIPALLPDGTKNPNNPYGQDITNANLRPFGGGDRVYTPDVQTYRIRAGLEGTIFSNYNWSMGYVYGVSDAEYKTQGDVNFYHLGQETGQFACGVDVASGCHLANFFAPLTSADIKYLEYTDVDNSQLEEDYFYANISGPIYHLPAGDVSMAFGVEQRNEGGFDHPDSVRIAGDADSDANPTQGAYSVSSGYAELNIPVLKDAPFVKSLTLDASARYDYYTSFGRALTWKTSVDYAITDDFRFRGSESTGFRAPQITELFGGQFQSFLTYNGDPCASKPDGTPASGTAAGSANCVAALKKVGVNPGTYTSQLDEAPAPQVATLEGGNATLKPENSQEFTVGMVFTPHWIQNLSFSTDYWNVHIRNAILDGGQDPNFTINACYNENIQSACNAITRGATGDITAVQAPNVNFGYENTQGIDFDLTYGFDSSFIGVQNYLPGHWQVSGDAQYLLRDDEENPDGTVNQLAGTFNTTLFKVEPRWKARLGVAYAQDAWGINVDERYLGGVKNDAPGLCLNDNPGGCDYTGNEAAGLFYTDVSATYTYKNINVTVGVQNLFDKDPPVIFGDICACNTLSEGNYDFQGRFVYMKGAVKF